MESVIGREFIHLFVFRGSLSDFNQNMFEDPTMNITQDFFEHMLKACPYAFRSTYLGFSRKIDNIESIEHVKQCYLNLLTKDCLETSWAKNISCQLDLAFHDG